MALTSINFFILIASLIFAGIISMLIFSRFKITDVLVLMLLGILLGPVFNVVDRTYFEPFMFVIGSFTLAMVLFNEGLNITINELKELGPRVLIFSLFIYFLSVALVTILVYMLDPVHDLFQSLVIGIVLGAPGPAVVLPVFQGLSLNDRLKKFLVMDVIITDAIAILLITALVILGMKDVGEFNSDLFSRFLNMTAISVFVGLLAGVLWVGLLSYYKQRFDYLLALGTMLLTYSVATILNSNGILAVFVLGFVMGNVGSTKLRELRLMQDEITFLIKTFFFIYLGILFDLSFFSVGVIFVAITLIASLLIARYVSVFVFNIGDAVTRPITMLVISRGLATSVMTLLVTNAKIVTFPSFLEIGFIIIFITNILATVGSYLYEKRVGYVQKINVGTVQAVHIEEKV